MINLSLNFETVSLGEHLYIKGRIGWKGLKKDEYLDQGDYRIINATALEEGGINWNDCGYISKERFEESPEIILKDKDILISKDGTIGKLGYVKNLDMDSTVASGIFVVRNQNEDYIDTDFLYYYFKSPFFKWFIKSVTEGSVIPHLYQRDFTDMEFNLFSLGTQKKCSSILNAIEEKINVNRKINKNLEEIAQSILNENFFIFSKYSEDQLIDTEIGNIPINWKIYKLKELFNHIKPGTNYQPKRVEEGIPFLNVKNINSGFIDISDVKYISVEDFKKVHKSWVPEENDILISRIGTLGLIAVIDKEDLPLAVHYNFINVKSNKLPHQFVYFLFKSNNFQRKYHTIKKYSVQEYVTIDDFSEIEIALPNTLNELNSQFELFKDIFDKIQKNILEIKKLQKLRDTLLPKLMSGEIDVSKIN